MLEASKQEVRKLYSTGIVTDNLRAPDHKDYDKETANKRLFFVTKKDNSRCIYMGSEFVLNSNLAGNSEILLLVHCHLINDDHTIQDEPFDAYIRFNSNNPSFKELFDYYAITDTDPLGIIQ